MQSKETLKRLTNPPIKDGRKKPIDLGDMPEDMDLELAKVAMYSIIEEVLEKYKDGNLDKKSLRHNIASEIFKKVVNDGWYSKLNNDTMQEDEKLVYEEDFGETRNAQNFISYRDTGDEHDGEPTTADEYNHEWLNEANRTGKESYLLINDRINELLERIQVLEKNKE